MTFDAVAFLTGLFHSQPRGDGGDAPTKYPESDVALSGIPADLPLDWHFAWDERAAILEFDAGFHREHAEALALKEVLERMRQAAVNGSNDACYSTKYRVR